MASAFAVASPEVSATSPASPSVDSDAGTLAAPPPAPAPAPAASPRCAHLHLVAPVELASPHACALCGRTAPPGTFFRCGAPRCGFAECAACAATSMRDDAHVRRAYEAAAHADAAHRRRRDFLRYYAGPLAVLALVAAGAALFAAGNVAAGGALTAAVGVACSCVALADTVAGCLRRPARALASAAG